MSSNIEKRERERERLKTLPYTLNFQHLSLILKICLKFTTALLSAKMGVFRTKFVTENVEQCRAISRNGRERGRGSKHYLTCQIFKKTIDRFSRASRKRFKLYEWTENVEWGYFVQKKMPACGGENKIGNFTQLSLDTKKYRTRGT